MDIRQLQAFVAVFEARNITQAAERLHLSQPTLSVTIRLLEDTLGTTLFKRQARGVAASEHARLLYPQARRLLAQFEALHGMFRSGEDCLPLTLGIDTDLSADQIGAFLRLARQSSTLLQLTLLPGCRGDARLAPEDQRCEDELFLPLWEEIWQLALPAGHPLTAHDTIRQEDLVDVEWIACPEHPAHQQLATFYGLGNVCFSAQAGTLALARELVAAGIGLAFLPASLLTGRADLASRPLSLPMPARRIGLCYAAQSLDLPALAALHANLLTQRADA
jgi:DNA-binding transcriptional LysR family regulator